MLRIITLNLNYYVEKHGPWENRKKLIINLLREKNPHIVAFQAVGKKSSGVDQALEICKALEGFQSHFFSPSQEVDGVSQGMAVISKFPMQDKVVFPLSLLEGKDDNNKRILMKVTFERPDGKFDFYNGHFSWVEEQSALNVNEALSIMKTGNNHQLLAGDLNTPHDSSSFQPWIDAGLRDAWKHVNPKNEGFTFESDKPFTRIDYFWLSPPLLKELNKVEILSASDGNTRLSDHLGLLLELNIKL